MRSRRWLGAASWGAVLGVGACTWLTAESSTVDVFLDTRFPEGEVSVESPPLVTTDLGYEVRLDSLELTTASVTLLNCEGVAAEATPLGFLLGSFVRTARAHELSDPRTLMGPVVEPLVPPRAIWLGTWWPEEGRYCAVRYRVAAPSAASDGPEAALTTFSLRVRGAWRVRDGQSTGFAPFELETSAGFEVRLELPQPLHLDDRGDRWAVVLLRDGSHALDGVDWNGPREAAARVVLANLKNTLRVEVSAP